MTIVVVVVAVVVVIICIPAKHSHKECHCGQHVTHGTREGRGGEFKPGVVKVLINHWSARSKKLVIDTISPKIGCHILQLDASYKYIIIYIYLYAFVLTREAPARKSA